MCLDSLSYHEAWELSYFGASVLHPRTTMPAMKYNIPITIRNFFNRSASGADTDIPATTLKTSANRCSAFLPATRKHSGPWVPFSAFAGVASGHPTGR